MAEMQIDIKEMIEKIDALSLREKTLIAATIAVVLGFTLQFLLIDPALQRQAALENRISAASKLNQVLQTQRRNSPSVKNAALKKNLNAEIRAVERQLSALDDEITKYAATLVSPDEMPGLLQVLLAGQSLQLIRMSNIDPVPMMDRVERESEEVTSINQRKDLYRHGISMQLRGNYHEVIGYLAKLEAQSWKLIWHSMKYEVIDYPIGELDLQLQTLSTEKHWLGV